MYCIIMPVCIVQTQDCTYLCSYQALVWGENINSGITLSLFYVLAFLLIGHAFCAGVWVLESSHQENSSHLVRWYLFQQPLSIWLLFSVFHLEPA